MTRSVAGNVERAPIIDAHFDADIDAKPPRVASPA
jgi:hypothetical protein